MKGHPVYKQILDELWDLHLGKSGAYGTKTDPLANFQAVAQAKGQPAFVYPLDRLQEKLARCYSLIEQGRFEELELLDIASLAVCAETLRRG